ncbi:Gfo/Idh/MocA family oxidoreductase [Motilimonas sp. E26]|uniref:Gfo/Idh/MocA family protein n=1 Tax=Motilimonas sp. E26 TaxID=2865674 RepID=UPI001E31F6CC|nr:Gfo/Idh/MocA family oxidoreductase [Motilimonas sp. E26]MCE0558245.1 Gfo/Idh/MocA family oxidoreductase [Motilimonas sp. E26]
MIKLAIVGTNWISRQFAEAALQSQQFTISAVYSRDIARAQDFAQGLACSHYFDDLNALANSDEVAAVYIASPNSLHYEQALLLLNQGKHVICEKPMAANPIQVATLLAAAKEHNVVLFEAFMTQHRPNFFQLKQHIEKIAPLRQVLLSYCQYSSRYPAYLAGDNPNTFNPNFANGSIVDIGYYCVATAVALFGAPRQVLASAYLLPSGVDGQGCVILQYPEFEVILRHSKISDSKLESELQGEGGRLLISHPVSLCQQVQWVDQDGAVTDISLVQADNPMLEEALAFAQQVKLGAMDPVMCQRSQQVADILYEVRRQTGVVFPTDED